MKTKIAASVQELLRCAYGSRAGMPREPASAEQLLRSYYGKPTRLTIPYGQSQASSVRAPKPSHAKSQTLQRRHDNGEMLPQRARKSVRASSRHVPAYGLSETTMPEVPPAQEAVLDLAPVSAPSVARNQVNTPSAVPTPPPSLPAPPELPVVPPTAAAPKVPETPIAASGLPQAKPEVAQPSASASGATPEDDFTADLEAILRGEKVYDPATRKTVDKGALAETRASAAPPPPPPTAAAPENESQAIFDRIAQSMTYANAYDLGSVELQNRFAAFDRTADEQHKRDKPAATPHRVRPVESGPPPEAAATGSDFIADLDAIGRNTQPALAQSLSQRQFSRALYDTGEHVLAAESTFDNRLNVGRAPGVNFSYGQVIALADMFESVDQMMSADVSELQAIKGLVVRSTGHYKNRSAQNPSNIEWQTATARRYLRLAEDNYDHFAPNLLFQNEAFASRANRYGNHKLAWENHHQQAIDEARAMALDPAHARSSYFPMRPLTINAFGDHFLTDAFAAGHVINKEAVIAYFRSTFYTGTSLTAQARTFLEAVARKAFVGRVASRFSRLETGRPYDAWWNLFNWNPNIDSAHRFGLMLIEIAEREPHKIANLAVKVIHDKLNSDGVQVTNDAGSGTWMLTGDGHLNTTTTLPIMQQAVQQSIDNINDPAILATNISYRTFMDRVWRFVPRLPPASESRVQALVRDLIRPTSATLIDKAAEIIQEEVESLITELVERGELQPA